MKNQTGRSSCIPLFRRGAVSTLQLSLFGVLMPALAVAQNRVNVSIDLGKGVNVLTDTSLSLPAPSYDGNAFSVAGTPYLRAAGIGAVHYPGNHGVADLYHWSTKSTTKYNGADPAYLAPESNFASFAQMAEKLGQATIIVNYGSNADGTGGGEPLEAAAWVAYANGDAADTRALGKDSTGKDWHTVGYWAAIRGQDPLSDDDGLNFLRIHHAKPFGFKLWQIGDEVYNDGYYGGEHIGNPDLHAPAPSEKKELGKLKGNPKLSPTAYGEGVKAFAQAMKAVDPAIGIGVALTTPPDGDKWAPTWNSDVLKSACAAIDYVTLEWTSAPLLPPDYKTLDEASLLSGTNASLGDILRGMLDDDKQFCPKSHVPRIAFTTAGIPNWPKIEHPVVETVWVANTYAELIESGSLSINWMEMYGDTMLSADRKKFGPVFYGLEMLHIVAHAPGDVLVDASSNSPLLGVHASRRRDGFVGVMLINKDPKTAATVKVSFKNGAVGATGKRFDYGSAQLSAGAGLASAPFTGGGVEFTITVPAYTVTDVVLPVQP